MKLPHGEAAIVDPQKLTGYCLNLEHPRGKHKARVFATLGLTVEKADELRTALLRPPQPLTRNRLRRTNSASAMW